MNAWQVPDDKRLIRRMGKLGEETNELACVAARIIIQGLDEIDPGTGKSNRQRLQEEMADVTAQIACTVALLDLDLLVMETRAETKIRQMREWEHLVKGL